MSGGGLGAGPTHFSHLYCAISAPRPLRTQFLCSIITLGFLIPGFWADFRYCRCFAVWMFPADSWLSISHMRISDFSFDGGTEHVTKCNSTCSSALILGALCTIFRAGPVWKGLGAKFGRKTAENRKQHKSRFQYPIMAASKWLHGRAQLFKYQARVFCWAGWGSLLSRGRPMPPP